MVFRFDPCGFFCILLTYAAVLYADYVFIYWLVRLSFGDSLWCVFHVVVFNTVLFLLLFSHIRAMIADPGMVPLPKTPIDFSDLQSRNGIGPVDRSLMGRMPPLDHDSDSDVSRTGYFGEDWTVCGRCEAYRPPRAHHCRICNRCIRKMDHHCPWINNCVGEFNQKYFLQFLIYVGIASIYCICVVILSWLWPCSHCHNERIQHLRVLHSIFVTVECLLFSLFVIAVSCDQFQAIFSDETAVEHVQKRGSYSKGRTKVTLLREVCGAGSVFLWILPCHSLPAVRDIVRLPTYYPV